MPGLPSTAGSISTKCEVNTEQLEQRDAVGGFIARKSQGQEQAQPCRLRTLGDGWRLSDISATPPGWWGPFASLSSLLHTVRLSRPSCQPRSPAISLKEITAFIQHGDLSLAKC